MRPFAPDNNMSDTAPTDPIPYVTRSRAYYLTQGYDNPYRWAQFEDVPFTPLRKPLARSRVALVTTAAEFQPELGDQGPRAPYNAAAKFATVYSRSIDTTPDLRISHIGYDRQHTVAEDLNAYFPLERMKEAVATGRIGELTPRFYAAPTTRSQRATIETDAPEILRQLREDGAEAAVLVPV